MTRFKISTNINRDANAELDFIVTKNANEVYNRIIHNHSRGQNSFSIIGSYGTGKSTFLWAFEHHLNGDVKFDSPVNGEFKGVRKFDFKRIVGEGTSFKKRFCIEFGLESLVNQSNKEVLSEFDLLCKDINSRNRALVILVDEFGKHLEFIAKHNPEEMFFIQELAEFCNDSSKQVLFITTLHQNFSVYAKGLSVAEKSEWDKVRGRLIDIAFDEPVEQLLFFASQRLKHIQVPELLKVPYWKFVKTIVSSQLLGKSLSKQNDTLDKLFPLDPLAADILTKSLQRYGQNERSLFTFLESQELSEKIEHQIVFTVPDCFDYLIQNLSSEVENGEKNPFKPQWKAAVLALEKAEILFENEYNDVAKLLKTICLVNIFSNANGTLDLDVLSGYAKSILGVPNPEVIIDKLITKRLIKFSNYRSKFNFIDGTDVDIEQELIDASQHIESELNLISRLESYFDFGIIPAKRIQFEFGTPRFFQFKFYDDWSYEEPTNEIDGHINLIFTKKRILKSIQEKVEVISPAQVFVLFKEIDQIEDTIFEIDKINYVIHKYSEDKVALRILNEEKLFRTNQLKYFVEGALFGKESKVSWIWNSTIDELNKGKKRSIYSYKALNKLLSDAAQQAYPNTPQYRNEMVNKEFLSSPILTARKALIRQVIANGDKPNLGFDEKRFPPEKTIYLSLLKETGIHKSEDGRYFFGKPQDVTLLPLWNVCEAILKSSSESITSVTEFYKKLRKAPFKLKQGFLDFWIHLFLVMKKEDYALYYNSEEYVPHLSSDMMDLIYKHPSKYFVKALSADGVRSDYLGFYKELTGFNESDISGLESSYITIYGNFLRFYRGLEDYTKKTKTALSKEALGVRNAIANAKDPESALFTGIPEALGYFKIEKSDEQLHSFLLDLQGAIKEIRGAYDQLVEQLELQIKEHLKIKVNSFTEMKEQLTMLFSGINKNLIANDKLRIFYTRVVSPLDVKKAYWESLCDSAIGKKLDQINDEEVHLLLDRIKGNFSTLLDLVDIHTVELKDQEEIVQFAITKPSGENSIRRNLIVSPKITKKSKEVQKRIEQLLGNETIVNKLALIRLLENELKKND